MEYKATHIENFGLQFRVLDFMPFFYSYNVMLKLEVAK